MAARYRTDKSRQIFLIEQEVKRTRHSLLNILSLFILLVERYVGENSRMIASMKLSYVTLYCNVLNNFYVREKESQSSLVLSLELSVVLIITVHMLVVWIIICLSF